MIVEDEITTEEMQRRCALIQAVTEYAWSEVDMWQNVDSGRFISIGIVGLTYKGTINGSGIVNGERVFHMENDTGEKCIYHLFYPWDDERMCFKQTISLISEYTLSSDTETFLWLIAGAAKSGETWPYLPLQRR